MNILRKAALVLAASLFSFTLFSFVILMGLYHTVGSAGELKRALASSGIYKTVVNNALTQAQKEQDKQPGQKEMDIPLSDPKVRAIISDALPPKYLQANVEKTLDSSYAWLKGDTPVLAFTIDLQDAKARLANGLAGYVHDKATTLPPCTLADLQQQQGKDFDAFTATCLPPGVDANAAAEQARNQLLTGEFLKDTKISADTIKNDKGQPLGEQLKEAPKVYKQVEQGVYSMGVLVVVLAVLIVVLSSSKREGLRKVAVISIIIGVTSAVIGWATAVGLSAATSNPSFSEPFQQSLLKVVQSMASEARTWWISLGLGLTVAGIVTLVVTHRTRPKAIGNQDSISKAPEQKDALTEVAAEQPLPKNTHKK